MLTHYQLFPERYRTHTAGTGLTSDSALTPLIALFFSFIACCFVTCRLLVRCAIARRLIPCGYPIACPLISHCCPVSCTLIALWPIAPCPPVYWSIIPCSAIRWSVASCLAICWFMATRFTVSWPIARPPIAGWSITYCTVVFPVIMVVQDKGGGNLG